MHEFFFLRGCVLGFSIAAPVGPIGILCIRRTLAYGRLSGLISGLGAATADALYGAIAAYGLTSVSAYLIAQQQWIRIIGGLFLLYLGIKTLRAQSFAITTGTKAENLVANYLSTLFLTLTNPMTIVAFVALFAGLGIVDSAVSYVSATLLVLGVFVGSAVWWLVLSVVVGALRARFKPTLLRAVNVISGSIIIACALFALCSGFIKFFVDVASFGV